MKRLGGAVLLANERVRAEKEADAMLCGWDRQEPWDHPSPFPYGLPLTGALPTNHPRLRRNAGKRRNKRRPGPLRGMAASIWATACLNGTSPPLTPDQQLKIDELLSHIR